MKRSRANNLVKLDVGGGANIKNKQARVLQYNRKRRIGPCPWAMCRSCHWAVKNAKNTA